MEPDRVRGPAAGTTTADDANAAVGSQWRNWVISVDDHVLEPAELWQTFLPAKHRDAGPRIVERGGEEAWEFEGTRYPVTGFQAVVGRPKHEVSNDPVRYSEMRPGCYDAGARLADMNVDHVLASLCFPSFPRFCGQRFYEANDKELGLACVEAYNDWMTEVWGGASSEGRLMPLIMLPLWDPVQAAKEIERCAAKGARGITFSENPAPLGLPSIHDAGRYWDPVFAAAQETGMPLCTHIGSSSRLTSTSEDAPTIIRYVLTPLNSQQAMVDWLFSGNFFRFPKLTVCLSEGGIGWIPSVLERCDHTFELQGSAITPDSWPDRDVKPSDLFRRHIFGCFIDDEHGSKCIDEVGTDNIMLETDYPHSDCNWPNSMELIQSQVGSLDDARLYQIMQGNARSVFNLDPSLPYAMDLSPEHR